MIAIHLLVSFVLVAAEPAAGHNRNDGQHIFGLSAHQLAAINEEFLPITGRQLTRYIDEMECSTDWRNLVLLQNSVLGAIRGEKFDLFLRQSFYEAFLADTKYKCFQDMYGHKFLYGLPSATHSLYEQVKIFRTLPGMSLERMRLRLGYHCEMVSNQDINALMKPFLDIFSEVGDEERVKFQEYISAMVINKVKVHFPSNAGPQLANDTHVCIDEVFVPMVTTYMVRKIENLPQTHPNKTMPSVSRMIRNLAIVEEVDEYHRNIGGMRIEDLKKGMEAAMDDEQTKNAILENLQTSSTRFTSSSSTVTKARPQCHPICRRLIGATRLFSHSKLVACCNQCFGITCHADVRYNTLLPLSTIQTPAKIYPYPVVSYSLQL